MHSQGLVCAYVAHNLHGFHGIDVLVVHEPAWRIGADRQDGQIWSTAALRYCVEDAAIPIGGVASNVEAPWGVRRWKPPHSAMRLSRKPRADQW